MASQPRRQSQVRLTERDTAALEWLAQQYGAPLDVVGKLLAALSGSDSLDRSAPYRVADRWRRLGRVSLEAGANADAAAWVVPTHRWATAYLGFRVGDWVPRPSTTEHTRALAEIRLALCGGDAGRWVSERQLRRLCRDSGAGHRHDAWFTDLRGRRWAIEAEISPKYGAGRLADMVDEVLTSADRHSLAGALYFARGAVVKQVETAGAAVAEHRPAGAAGVQVFDLDALLAKRLYQRKDAAS